MYPTLFLVRYFPFWGIPIALVIFELGLYHYHRRERLPAVLFFGFALFIVFAAIVWLVFEGYWRAGPFVKRFLEVL
jgi:hypothetical protein